MAGTRLTKAAGTRLRVTRRRPQASDYILLIAYPVSTIDEGGFAWWMHQVACLCYLCEKCGKKPIVWLNRGAYYEPKKGPNWWTYYFEQPLSTLTDEWIEKFLDLSAGQKRVPIRSWQQLQGRGRGVWQYDNETFQQLLRPLTLPWPVLYRKWIRLNQEMLNMHQNFIAQQHIKAESIACHYRGTDKFHQSGCDEDMKTSRHLTYEQVGDRLELLQRQQSTRGDSADEARLILASDEQPFLDAMQQRFGEDIIITWPVGYRSSQSTSGWALNSLECEDTPKIGENKDCAIYRQAISQSLHRRGALSSFSEQPPRPTPWELGKDVVQELWLLSRAKVFVTAHGGNFSAQVSRIRPDQVVLNLLNGD